MRFDRGVRPTAVARTQVDPSATRAVADQFTTAAELIDGAVDEHLARLTFGGAVAGRAHTARGDALRAELGRLTTALSEWARACSDIAAALRASADRYVDAELYAAARIA
ncbi:type VII secretion target [Mycobacterium sp. Marseille-P9652]|uniref:type VII secretion target n=1 Tax=Mycobacterium sp. Marseille-P9652 TaxID=2654950 RepID=UPI0012E97718|nr:type VII secretion target [Mycobacterium sp. Marseille-P9652]